MNLIHFNSTVYVCVLYVLCKCTHISLPSLFFQILKLILKPLHYTCLVNSVLFPALPDFHGVQVILVITGVIRNIITFRCTCTNMYRFVYETLLSA